MNRTVQDLVRLFAESEEQRDNGATCDSCAWWNKRKRGECGARLPWWVDCDMPNGVPLHVHMPPKTKAIFCEMYLPNDQAHGRAIARPVERLVVPDSEPDQATKKS